jgi:hypothetical protein
VLSHAFRLIDTDHQPSGACESLEEAHFVQEVGDPGELVAGVMGRGLRPLLDVDAATGLAHDESLVAKNSDRLLDGHPGDAKELGEVIARGQLVPARVTLSGSATCTTVNSGTAIGPSLPRGS